jgi:hypothetical protein
MKKILLALSMLLVSGYAFANPDQAQYSEYSGSQVIVSKQASVCNVIVTFSGVTIGDQIQLLDGTSSSGTARIRVMANAVDYTTSVKSSDICGLFNAGVYYKETKQSGTIYTDVQYLNAI